MEYLKTKTPAKQVTIKSQKLDDIILNTMKTISSIVGGTLGPGGQPVLIERQEYAIGPMVTKDGVTVFKSLGFTDPTAHCIMEGARDAAVRTANEAGDGTTSATILSESIVSSMKNFCKQNPLVSPQKIVRELELLFKTVIEPKVKSWSRTVTLGKPEDSKVIMSVAKISANGDKDLAEAVMRCYDITGDAGNVSITEATGPSKYEVEKIDGYQIEQGYEDTLLKFQDKFVNPATGAIVLDNPKFVLYNGKLTDHNSLDNILFALGQAFEEEVIAKGINPNDFDTLENTSFENRNVVIVANGFSEMVIGQLGINYSNPGTINAVPLLAPLTPQSNGQQQLLLDLAAIASATVLDPLTKPIDRATLYDLGPGVKQFQCGRTKSVVLGYADTDLLEERIEEVQKLLESPLSDLDMNLLRIRLGKLSGGIAKLRIWGSSNGEVKEKKDRAEDAVCAVKGAIRAGVLPGGGHTLARLVSELSKEEYKKYISVGILTKALLEPCYRLCFNSGLNHEEADILVNQLINSEKVYDFQEHNWVDPFEAGILDSTPAVLEAIRSSLSIATLLGTLGGTIVQTRNYDFEKEQSASAADWERNANVNIADDRG